MDGILYNVLYNEEEKTIRIVSDELPIRTRKKDEKMIGQTEGSDNARHMESIINRLRPDLTVDIIGEDEEEEE